MAGLRERKRARTEAAIIEAAADLFTEKGFEETTVEKIAERAEVGVGTLYNYFASKRDLLVAMFVADAERSIRVGDQVLARAAEAEPADAIAELLYTYMVERLFSRKRPLMRVIGTMSLAESPHFDRRIVELARQHLEQVAELLRLFQRQGALRADLPLESAAFVLFSNFLSLMLWYFRDPDLAPERIREILRGNVALVLQSWKPSEPVPASDGEQG